ncbi:MAG: 4-hydroxyphenylpyruvate dioxygenase [Coleofasciculaceae cyanobacterium]
MKFDHIHFYLENAKEFRDWFVNMLGFQPVSGGSSSHTYTEVVKSGSIYFVLSSPLNSTSPVAQFLRLHPPGVADVAFFVEDIARFWQRIVQQGAEVLQPLQEYSLSQGRLKWGKISAWDTLNHTILERRGTSFGLPIEREWVRRSTQCNLTRSRGTSASTSLFTDIDHVVLNVAAGDLGKAVRWYQNILGFQPQQMFAIQTEQSGLCSQVMIHSQGEVQLPINEPASANSQIQEFLNVNRGSGIQHIALATSAIVPAIAQLRSRGLSFIEVPPSYYSQLQQRFNTLDLLAAEWQEVAAQQILVDWQDTSPQALLLQTFTQPIFKEPTLFFEVIERRKQAKGFGEGNFRALFEAIEREQLKRGSLGS